MCFILLICIQKIFLAEISFICVLFTLFFRYLLILHFKVYFTHVNLSTFFYVREYGAIIMSEINKRIYKIIRSDKKLTQSGLASYLGKSSSTLSQWFSEDRPIPADCIIPICEYLDVSIMWLLTGSDYSNKLFNKQNYIEEQNLLQNFSSLPKNVKERVIGYVEGHLDALKNPPN